MEVVNITETLILQLPDNYKPVPLPYFNEWVDALESGKYLQGKGCLYDTDNNKYCCLGVLSKIQGRLTQSKSMIDKFVDDSNQDGSYGFLAADNPCVSNLSITGLFPPSVRVFKGHRETATLYELNDLGVPFTDIAQIIRHVWKSQ